MSGKDEAERVDLDAIAGEFLSKEVLRAIDETQLVAFVGKDEFFVAIRGRKRRIVRLLALVVVMAVLYVL